jgi:hypothetical protein
MTMQVLLLCFLGLAPQSGAAERAQALASRLDPADPTRYADALAALQNCGPAALPVFRTLLADETRFRESPLLLDSLVKAAGKTAIPVLEDLLRDEKTYWNNLGMNLDDPDKIPAIRADRLVAILRHLAALGYRDRYQLVRDLRDQFRDHPVLNEYGRTGGSMTDCPILEAANRLVSAK